MPGKVAACWLVLGIVGYAQAPTHPAFDVASVKPNRSGARGGGAAIRPGRFDATNLTLRQLIIQAYGIPDSRLVGGDSWTTNERFDVAARTEQASSRPTTLLMAQQLLEDRFQLRLRSETRIMRAYTLSVSKNGAKIKANTAEGQGDMSQGTVGGRFRVSARRMPLSVLMPLLEKELGQPVRDETRLEGLFDFEVQWASELSGVRDGSAPSVFSAVQEQLGLRLESTRSPVDVLVIDRAEKPSEN